VVRVKAAILVEPGRIEFRDVEMPRANANEALIRVRAASICGTDVHIFEGRWKVSTPRIMGHEGSGEAVEVGSGVTKVDVGDRVVVAPLIRCGNCRMCRTGRYNICERRRFVGIEADGVFAEYIKVDQSNVELLPDDLSFEEGALVEPVAVAVHAVRRGGIPMNSAVVVLGAGPIGLCAIRAAKAAGAGEVLSVDLLEERLSLASELGADEVINPKEANVRDRVLKHTGGRGADVVIEASGSPEAYKGIVDLVSKGGKIVQIGLPLANVCFDMLAFSRKELELIGCNGHMMDLEGTLDLVRKDKTLISKMITHRLPLRDVRKGMEMAREGKGVKIVLLP
jgi:2-desacetyl-2-hydroxyethyl bacteriochlorophyllide A dehydrogenase